MPSAIAVIALAGCSPAIDTATIDTALPLVEPAVADKPVDDAARQFQSSLTSLPEIGEASTACWPQLFGPDRTSALPHHHLNVMWPEMGPREVWSIPCGTGYGSPVTASGLVVFNHRIDDEEIIQCVSVDDGRHHWQHAYPTTFSCDYEYSDGPYGTPVISDDCVYALGGQGQFYCLDLDTGVVRWSRDFQTQYDLEDGAFPTGSAPLVTKDGIFLNIGAGDHDAGIVALNRLTGETIWTATDHGAAYCSPITATIHDQDFLFVMTDIGLVSLDPSAGDVDWMIEHRCRSPLSFNAVSPLVRDDKVLAISGPSPGAVCVQVQPDRSYVRVWKSRRVLNSQYNTLMLADDLVFGFTSSGQGGAELRCIEFDTGKMRWKYHSVLRRGQGLMAGNGLILLGERGHLASLLRNGDEPTPLAFTAEPIMQEPCYCAPAIHGSRLILKDESRVACFDLESSP